ncbi:MAG: hypothetical protein ACLPUG_13680 [Acidimicrobiales bacterium]
MFKTIEDVKRANREAGYHFFDKDTCRFFGSRIGETLYAGRYFITSEQQPGWRPCGSGWVHEHPRGWTIREAHQDGSVSTVGEFQEFATRSAALAALRWPVRLAEAEHDGYHAGHAAGTWVTDGNTSEATYRAILDGYESGDSGVMDYQPAPLSGEWADDPGPRDLFAGWDRMDDWQQDEIATAYEAGYSDGFWSEVVRSCRYALRLEVAS